MDPCARGISPETHPEHQGIYHIKETLILQHAL